MAKSKKAKATRKSAARGRAKPVRAKPAPRGASRAARSSSTQQLARRSLYPAIEPYRTGYLRVSDIHETYFEECGNPRGKPALFVHGGPGAGAGKDSRRFFDPKRYRIVLFDQRGCGRSRPAASLDDNTTWHLVSDMEALRDHLDVERWLVFGGSWGSTLALAYAQKHPERVSELVLRGIFMLRQAELRWFYQQGASELFADWWKHYLAPIPPGERGDLIAAFHRRLTGKDPRAALEAAKAWSIWEAATSYLQVNEQNVRRWSDEEFATALARIECHYFVNRGFFEHEDQLLRGVDAIRNIPAVIVQGRYDVVCPMVSAWDLHEAWPQAEFHLVPDSGHSAFEPGTLHQLITATDRFARR